MRGPWGLQQAEGHMGDAQRAASRTRTRGGGTCVARRSCKGRTMSWDSGCPSGHLSIWTFQVPNPELHLFH